MLKPPFEPWIEVHGQDTILRSNSFDELTSTDEVRDRAVAHIERLNGAMFVMMQGQPLQFWGVVEFASDGTMHRTLFAERNDTIRARMHASALVIGADGKEKPPAPPTQTEVQRWAAIADNDDLLEDALIYFGRVSAPGQPHPPTFWFDIYKALECLVERFGGNKKREDTFFALDWVPPQVERLKQTANWSRHARRKYKKPSQPTTEQEAIELMVRLLRKAFENVGP
ncbi:hypothetical protein NLM33_34890 [Bradyrhizobium sp. CCGUVB1N3]|uniref:hypothetical protein n=1 Tax=Bradyrhizobium sp. CCGUVB1N3 TaxID=2949629 RepID=UPI0020B27B54|nr:hypothetical protein [Bradyrhizobium sp. CCGUVB1N3]MCP3475488.1 hypothetical protein [Bradyrhizobium sp. CCGUVB1N3]